VEARENGVSDGFEYVKSNYRKIMKPFLILVISVLLTSCLPSQNEIEVISLPATPEIQQPDCKETESAVEVTKAGIVSFENVSFAFDRNRFDGVDFFASPACVLVSDQYKPDPIGGRTLHFNPQYKDSDEKAEIEVFKIQEYKDAFAKFPDYLGNRDTDFKNLLLDTSRLKTFGADAPPHVRWMDAFHIFYAKARKVNFVNGSGLLIVTVISQEVTPIDNSMLIYFYQGFSTDGQYFVEMTFPVRMRGLPEQEDLFLSDGKETYEFDARMPEKIYERYVLKTAQKIDRAATRDFEPRLDEIEKFIHGFTIE